jgi:hypothetical protein
MDEELSPVLFIGFNRPDLLSKSLEKLQYSKRTIYISIDGPRHEHDLVAVSESKKLATDFKNNQKGHGAVHLLLHDSNLGCKKAVQKAIDWIFDEEETAIILEDDIFFTDEFLLTMDSWLRLYKEQKEIFHLNGFNPLPKSREPKDAYLCRYTHVWGWATWRDRWQHYDRDLAHWDPNTFRSLPGLIGQDLPEQFFAYWGAQIDMCLSGLDTWDIQWAFSQWVYGGFSMTPGSRLTGNQGFDSRATHTQKSGNTLRERLPTPSGNRFLFPNSPYLDLELNKLHDEIEHGIFPKNSQLVSSKWKMKIFFARCYLKMVAILPPSQLVRHSRPLISLMRIFTKKIIALNLFFEKSIKYLYWRILRQFILQFQFFILKCFKFFYWRFIRIISLSITTFIVKSFKYIYWRGIKKLLTK